MTAASPIEVVLKFEQLINSRNPDAICGLLTEDSVFIDSLGNRAQGLENLRKAWRGYFKMVPDYSISHAEIFADGETVAVFGTAQGTFSKTGEMNKEDFWKIPAAWRASARRSRQPIRVTGRAIRTSSSGPGTSPAPGTR